MSELPKPPSRVKKPLPKTIDISELSEETIDVLESFGLEAPKLLNDYACALEDALVEQVALASNVHKEVKRLRKLLEQNNIPH